MIHIQWRGWILAKISAIDFLLCISLVSGAAAADPGSHAEKERGSVLPLRPAAASELAMPNGQTGDQAPPRSAGAKTQSEEQ
jgi:hypothetical protein